MADELRQVMLLHTPSDLSRRRLRHERSFSRPRVAGAAARLAPMYADAATLQALGGNQGTQGAARAKR